MHPGCRAVAGSRPAGTESGEPRRDVRGVGTNWSRPSGGQRFDLTDVRRIRRAAAPRLLTNWPNGPAGGGRVGETSRSQRKLGALVLVGGAEDRTGEARVLAEFVRLAGGPRAKLLVATVATELPAEGGGDYVTAFRRLGCKDARPLDIPDRAKAADPATAAKLDAATGVFFTGGNQLRITNLIGGTPVDAALHRRRAEGLTIGGTSAGAAMMSGTMIVGGANEAAPRARGVEGG